MSDELVKQLQNFAQGCRGSMWQSRDETIRLCDEAARALLQARADAAAAQAAMIERAAGKMDAAGHECLGCGHICGDPEKDMSILRKAGAVSCCPERKMAPLGDAIRSLAPDAGTAELARLRERAEKADGMVKRLAQRIRNQRIRLRQMEGFKCRCCDLMAVRLQRLKRSNAYRAERDTLAAALAAQAELVATLTGAAALDCALDAMEANMRADGQAPLNWRKDLPPEDQDKLRACVRAGIAAALEAATIASWPPEQQALFKRVMEGRDRVKPGEDGRVPVTQGGKDD